jgi:ADP-ribosylglycohydrolase
MLGLAVGDAVGTTVEFKAPGTFPLVRDMVGGGPFGLQPGEWTDDTSMALCLAESLITCRSFNAHDQIKRYIRWWKEGHLSSNGKCFDIGNTVSQALQKYQASNDPFAGSSDSNTAGNGSLMRLASIPLFFASDPEKAIMMSSESSKITHGARACLDACRYFGGLLVGAVQGESKDKLLSPHYTPVEGLWNQMPLCHEIDEVAGGSFKRKEPPQIVGSGYVVKALEAALWAFYRSSTFEDGCLLAVNLGNDADTTAAIYGQIAGAYYGIDGIPARWIDRLVYKDDIVDIARHLYAQSEIEVYVDREKNNDHDKEECPSITGLDIDKIVELYDKDELVGPDDLVADQLYLWPRFIRAVGNQDGNGPATVSRYAIWANTVKGFIVEAKKLIREDMSRDAEKLLVQAANSLSAFSEVQAYFDPLEVLIKGQKFKK